jgi:transposase-like protein
LLAIKSMGGESTEAWRAVLDDLIRRGLRRPDFLIVDGAPGLDNAIATVWDGVPVQRCSVHKHIEPCYRKLELDLRSFDLSQPPSLTRYGRS